MNSSTIRETIQGVLDGLAPLANKLGVAVEGLWGWSLRHTYAIAITDFVEAVLFAGMFVGMIYFTRFALKNAKEEDDDYDFGWWKLGTTLSIIAIVFLAFGFIYNIEDGINRLIAPEYYTIKDLIELTKGRGI